MRVYIRSRHQEGFQGPIGLPEVQGRLASGQIAQDAEWVEAVGQTEGQLKRTSDWKPLATLPGGTALEPPMGVRPDSLSNGVAAEWRGSTAMCTTIGSILFVVGVYLLWNPTPPGAESDGPGIVNLQMLYLGQTLTVSGVIFLAVAARPR